MRWRLLLWQGFLLACLVLAFGVTASRLNRTNRFSQIDEELESRTSQLAGDVRTPPRIHGPPPEMRLPRSAEEQHRDAPPADRGRDRMPRPALEMPVRRELVLSPATQRLFDEGGGVHYFAVWTWDGSPLRVATNAPPDLARPAPAIPPAGMHTRTRGSRREVYQFTELGDCVLVGRSVAQDLASMRRFNGWLIAAGLAVLCVGVGGGWVLTDRAVRPIEDISAAASRISAGNLAEQIAVRDPYDEIGRLAGVLNATFSRLEAAFARQRQFTADAAHELRTPIAVLLSETQTALARPRSDDEYRETVQTCLDTAQQMRALTQSLLALARLDNDRAAMACRPCNPAALVRRCMEQVRPWADHRGMRLACTSAEFSLEADPDGLQQVITNLLLNAVDYGRAGGEVSVHLERAGQEAILTVSDTGQGIAPEDLPRVFDRFFRADPSRSDAGGHCGLGLAICKAIVDAHGGTITLTSQRDAGTTATVRLPRAAEAAPGGDATAE
jgi:heavy metal sensor kinase